MINPKDVTLIIPHLGGTKESEYSLDQCLESLKDTFEGRIMVVINGEKCFRHAPIADLIIKEQGQCRAANAAAAMVNTPWIMVSNDDMIYPPEWWDRFSWVVEKNGKYFKCLSPKLVEPRPGAPTFETYFCGGAGGDFDKQKWLDYVAAPRVADCNPGFNLPFLISKDLWDTVGGYDINYDPWGSNGDSDLEYKIKLAGVQPYQNTGCLIYHFSQTSGTFLPENDSHRFKNYAFFKEKWGFDRTDNGIWEATFTIPSFSEGRKFNPSWEGKYGD